MISKSTNIYLDIDGTIIHEDLAHYKQPAAHLHEFLEALKDYPVYWLTTHCCEGNPERAQRHLKNILPKELFQYVLAYKPTIWGFNKTEGIDFASPFIWFDNNVASSELADLARHSATDSLIKVNLRGDQLRDIVNNLFAI